MHEIVVRDGFAKILILVFFYFHETKTWLYSMYIYLHVFANKVCLFTTLFGFPSIVIISVDIETVFVVAIVLNTVDAEAVQIYFCVSVSPKPVSFS